MKLVVLLAGLLASTSALAFTCAITDADTGVITNIPSVSKSEDYMKEINYNGLTISTMANEAGDSYNVQINENGNFVVSADVIYYPDASLNYQTLVIQCEK